MDSVDKSFDDGFGKIDKGQNFTDSKVKNQKDDSTETDQASRTTNDFRQDYNFKPTLDHDYPDYSYTT